MNLMTREKIVLHCGFDAKNITSKDMTIIYTSQLQDLLLILDHYDD